MNVIHITIIILHSNDLNNNENNGRKKDLSHVIVHRLFFCMQKYHSYMVILRNLFARTQKRLCRNRLWKSGAGAPQGSPS